MRSSPSRDALDNKRADTVRAYGPIELERAEAMLFVGASALHPPDWARFLLEGFGEDVEIPLVGGASALLVVRIELESGFAYLGFTFGQGRFLLRNDIYERGFGLKTALNIVFEGDDGSEDVDPARLRSIDSKRVGEHLLRSRHQVPDVASLEGLDIDARRDLLRGVTGLPRDEARWGGRVTGADALSFSHRGSLAELGLLCGAIVDASGRSDYQARSGFVDQAKTVLDPVLKTMLEEEVLGSIRAGHLESLDLAPPELIDWERVVRFQYHSERRAAIMRNEIRLSDYAGTLRPRQMTELDWDRLRNYRIYTVDAEGKIVHSWSVWNCLYGEVEHAGKSYFLEDGDFYEVSSDFLAELDSELSQIAECSKVLPAWTLGSTERDYNLAAAAGSPDYLLLDRRLLRVMGQTSSVEICDVLTSDACWIHVKRRTDGSKGLGHLFWQGFVSAELLLRSPEYRAKAIEKIKEAEDERALDEGDDSFKGRFRVVETDLVSAADHEIVYAIIGRWDGKGLGGLPFFSKIALRETVAELKLRGLRVSVKLVAPA